MANKRQLARLLKGVEGWNKWVDEQYSDVEIDLKDASIIGANLKEASLDFANLMRANLVDANLNGAYFFRANLRSADLRRADLQVAILSETDLREVNFREANLSGANLSKAKLSEADLSTASLIGADLTDALLTHTNLSFARLNQANLKNAKLGSTVLAEVDLSETKGLGDISHYHPSPISSSTLQLSKGKIPVKFLRGCGLSDWEIESAKLYKPGLSPKEVNDIVYRIYDLRATQAIQINNLFISYSHKDRTFVDEMEKYLDQKGIRFWRDIHHATAGRLEKVVDRAIRQNPIVLLILSEHSVKSDWVEHEARTARELEKELGRDVLCPVALDDAWKDCDWSAVLRDQIMKYNILDFSKWKDDAAFGKMFRKLVDGLDMFYKEG